METKQFGYSTKNIPIPPEKEYRKMLIEKTENLCRRMRWKAHFFLNPDIEAEEKLNIRHRLLINDIQLPDPFTMNAINDFKHCPSFGLFDIFNHLNYRSSDYDKQGLASFKSYEDYSLFHDGYVESLDFSDLSTYIYI